jgi:hypothetical protein
VSQHPTNHPSKQHRRSDRRIGVKQLAHDLGIKPGTLRRRLQRERVRRRGLIWLWSEDEARQVIARYRNGGWDREKFGEAR